MGRGPSNAREIGFSRRAKVPPNRADKLGDREIEKGRFAPRFELGGKTAAEIGFDHRAGRTACK